MVRDGICGESAHGLKNSSSRFKLILCCFLPNISPILAPVPNFIQIGWKTQKLKFFTIGQFWLVGLVGQKMVIGISNSFYVVFTPILASIPNFIQIGQKTKLKIFTIGQFWLVRLVGRKMIVGIWNSFYVVFSPILAPIPNFIQIRRKTQKLKIFTIGRFWLVGLVGKKWWKLWSATEWGWFTRWGLSDKKHKLKILVIG